MAYGQDKVAEAHYQSPVRDARENLRKVLARSRASGVPMDRTWVDFQAPNEDLLRPHVYTLDYYEQIATFQSEVTGGLWEEAIDTVEVPESNGQAPASLTMDDYDREMAANYPHLYDTEFDDYPPGFTTEPLRLSEMAKWDGRTVEYYKTARVRGSREVAASFKKRVVLSPWACGRLFTQLNKCFKSLRFTPDLDPPPDQDQPTEVPAHILENAPAFTDREGFNGDQ